MAMLEIDLSGTGISVPSTANDDKTVAHAMQTLQLYNCGSKFTLGWVGIRVWAAACKAFESEGSLLHTQHLRLSTI